MSIDVVVARIGKPHGIRGQVTVDVRTDEPELRFAAGSVLRVVAPRGAVAPVQSLRVAAARLHQGTWLLSFDEIEDRNAAESLRGLVLHVELPEDATPEDPEEFYAHQLVGLEVVDTEGRRLGEVSGLTPGAQDLLAVRTEDGRTALVPFVSALVPTVDLEAGRLVVADRPGLVTPFPEDDS